MEWLSERERERGRRGEEREKGRERESEEKAKKRKGERHLPFGNGCGSGAH